MVSVGGLDSWDVHTEMDCYWGAFEEAVELDANVWDNFEGFVR